MIIENLELNVEKIFLLFIISGLLPLITNFLLKNSTIADGILLIIIMNSLIAHGIVIGFCYAVTMLVGRVVVWIISIHSIE